MPRQKINKNSYTAKVTLQFLEAMDAIKRRREKGLLTDAEIAERLKLTPPNITYMRQGKQHVNLEQLGRMIDQFKVSADFLFMFKGKPFGGVELNGHGLNDWQKSIESRLKKLEKK